MKSPKVEEIEKKVDSLSSQARLDKINLTNINLKMIEFPEDLEEKGFLINGKNDFKYYTLSGECFTNLNIADEKIGGVLKFGVNYAKKHTYSKFTTSVINDFGTNLICNSIADYKRQLDQIREYLTDEYRVHVDFNNCILNSIEINKTFAIEDDISQYHRVLQLIANNVPNSKRMNQINIFGTKSEGLQPETFVITSKKSTVGKNGKISKSKQYEELVIYSKSNQIEKIISLNREYMRIEIRIVSSVKIKKMLGTNKFHQLDDDLINDFFDKEMKELIIEPYQKWQQERNKQILRLMRKQKLQDPQNWIVNTLLCLANDEITRNVPVILDVTEILPLVDELNIEDKGRRYKIRQAFKSQAQKRATVFCNGDNQKMQEIISNLEKKEMVSPLLTNNYQNMENNLQGGDTVKMA